MNAVSFWGKFKAFFLSKKFLRFITSFLVALLVLVVICVLFWPYVLEWLARVYLFFTHKDHPKLALSFGLATLIIVGVILIVKIGIPIGRYIALKSVCYFRLLSLNFRKGYKVKLTRIPFASITKMSSKGDILVKKENSIYLIHFIDILMNYSRCITILDGKNYIVTKAVPDKLGAYGATLIDGKSYYNLFRTVIKDHTVAGGKVKSFPSVDDSSIQNVVILCAPPDSKFIIRKNTFEDLNNGDSFGKFSNYSLKSLISFLRRK